MFHGLGRFSSPSAGSGVLPAGSRPRQARLEGRVLRVSASRAFRREAGQAGWRRCRRRPRRFPVVSLARPFHDCGFGDSGLGGGGGVGLRESWQCDSLERVHVGRFVDEKPNSIIQATTRLREPIPPNQPKSKATSKSPLCRPASWIASGRMQNRVRVPDDEAASAGRRQRGMESPREVPPIRRSAATAVSPPAAGGSP